MTEQIVGAESANPAAGNGTPGAVSLDTNAARRLPPSTLLDRSSKIEFVDAHGSGQEAGSAHILDRCPVDVMNVEGAWILISWKRLCVVELVGA